MLEVSLKPAPAARNALMARRILPDTCTHFCATSLLIFVAATSAWALGQ